MTRKQQLKEAIEAATTANIINIEVLQIPDNTARICDIKFEELELSDVVALSLVLPPFTLTAELDIDRDPVISVWWYE